MPFMVIQVLKAYLSQAVSEVLARMLFLIVLILMKYMQPILKIGARLNLKMNFPIPYIMPEKFTLMEN